VKSAVPWLSIVLAALAACGEPEAARGPEVRLRHPAACPALAVAGEPAPRSVIFVLSDTLRRDRLGAYGGPARTPAFDRLAAEGVLFTNVATQAPWTKPSIATLFTGLYPSQHGVVSHPTMRSDAPGERPLASDALASEHVTLAEALSASGWRTAAFVSNPWLRARLGFAQGFDVWDDALAGNDTPGALVSRAGLGWLRALPADGRPFFLYLHYMDAHGPYRPLPEAVLAEHRAVIEADPRPVSPQTQREISKHARDEHGELLAARGVPTNLALVELVYDLGVEAFDAALATLLDELERIPVARGAALVVTSDHGESLYRRGWGGHGYGFFEGEIGVPLVVRWPGLSAAAPVDCPLGLIDLRSTLCDLLALECGGLDQGRSLLAAEAPPEEGRIVLSEGAIERPRHRAARDRRWKLLYEPDGRLPDGAQAPSQAFSLYDLESDPLEQHDLLGPGGDPDRNAGEFARLKAALESGIAALDVARPEQVPLDEPTRERLEALGYAGEEAGR
jgi:arylsulfatase A-like enzyme